MKKKYNGLPKATYYARLKKWTLTLYDKDGNEFYVSPKHVMMKGASNETNNNQAKESEVLTAQDSDNASRS